MKGDNLTCAKCGYGRDEKRPWIQRGEQTPKECPQCKSRYWREKEQGAMNNEQRDRFYAIAERFCQEHAEDIIDVYRYPPVPEAQLIATRGLRGFDAVSCIECAVLPLGGLSEREECNRVYLRKLWRAASRSSRTEL